MIFSTIFYNVIIQPIEFIIEWIFNFYNIKISIFGVAGAIVAVSMCVNFLALPLYAIADSLQEKERNTQLKLQKWVKHIKKHFKGDERFMLLQAYYRENNYHPLYALRSSLSILIEIPFFIAAYHFLSHSTALKGASFAFLCDLGAPDNLFSLNLNSHIININILPILMTLINFVSGAIYLKKAPFKEKVQLYTLSLVFLVILYNSPSGLVCYWILNNIFSLVKNIVMQHKNPKKILHIIICFILISLTSFFLIKDGAFIKKLIVLFFTLIIILLPKLTSLINKKIIRNKIENNTKVSRSNFVITFLSGLGTALLAGFLLPTIIISSSPIEFAFLGNTDSPLSYIFTSFLVFFGFFVFWPCTIYLLFGSKVKRTIPVLSFFVVILTIFNAFVFKYDYGIIDIIFNLEHSEILKNYSPFYSILPIVFFVIISCILFILYKKNISKFLIPVCLIVCLAQFVYGIVSINKISTAYTNYLPQHELEVSKTASGQIEKIIHLSTSKKNVIVFFMDRAIGCYLPYFLDQFPQYKSSFDGFINFENTLSYGAYTLTGSPPLMGGYEYTPDEMRIRNNELLSDKHNEASILIPTLFSEKGWHSTIINPPWPNYKTDFDADYSQFEKVKNTTAHNLIGVYSKKFKIGREITYSIDNICRHEIVQFNVLQILPPLLRNTFYGNFRAKVSNSEDFINDYSALYYINDETDFDSEFDNYVFYTNNTVHSPTFLNETFDFPSYTSNKNTGNYKTINDFETQLYEVYCAAFIKLAEYFDFLRDNNAYNNTRIIIVSDHGYHVPFTHYKNFNLKDIENTLYDFKVYNEIPNSFDCTLMFKDFNCNEPIQNNKEFMTNADTLSLVRKDLDLSDTNPFTGKKFTENKSNGMNLFFQVRKQINAPDLAGRNTMTYDELTAWHFNPGDIDNPKNWIPYTIWKESNAGASK